MTQSILKLSEVRIELYVNADVTERYSCTSFEDAIKFVESFSKPYFPLDSIESFVSVMFADGTYVSYSMYSAKSLILLLISFNLMTKLSNSLNLKGKTKNGKKKS